MVRAQTTWPKDGSVEDGQLSALTEAAKSVLGNEYEVMLSVQGESISEVDFKFLREAL